MQAHDRSTKHRCDFDSQGIIGPFPLALRVHTLILAYEIWVDPTADPGFRNNLHWNPQSLHAHSSEHCIYRLWARWSACRMYIVDRRHVEVSSSR